ncbi:MAG: hypothetical protein J0L93_06305 [Deltaproteobacteria bacterium]|nr:hypothetical protein [Deltaproteobacteria bacterium]
MNFILRFVLTVAFVLSVGVQAKAGGVSDGGGGRAEQNISFAFMHLNRFIELCLQSETCKITAAEKNILQSIQKSLASEQKNTHPLVFKSGDSSFFRIDGDLKVAKTDFKIGSPVYFNVDMLYIKAADGKIVAMDIAEAVGILIHELAHHQGERDHSQLDLLAAKVRQAVQARIQHLDMGKYQSSIQVDVIDWNVSNEAATDTQLIISDALKTQNLSSLIRDQISCPFKGSTLSGYWLWNIHWNLGESFPSFDQQRLWKQPLRGRLNYYCKISSGETVEVAGNDMEISIYFSEAKDDLKNLEFSSKAPEVEVIDCLQNPGRCH